MREILIREEDEGQRLDKFLRRYLSNAGSGFLYKMLRKKNIVLNEKKADGKEILKQSDVIRMYFSDETLAHFTGEGDARRADVSSGQKLPDETDMEVIYEDSNVLICSKPAGMLSQPDEKGGGSAVDWARDYLLRKKDKTEADFLHYRPGVLNRLDQNTSGLLLTAKNLKTAQVLSACIRNRTIEKYYYALVKGTIHASVMLEGHLLRDEKRRIVKISKQDGKDGSAIQTGIRPVRYFEPLAGERATLLEVHLITGRTHQIRAHLAFEGHPLAGDRKYGDAVWNRRLKEEFDLKRQFLHAYRMRFPKLDSFFGQLSEAEIRSELPLELQKIIKRG